MISRGIISVGELAEVYDSAVENLGKKAWDKDGNEYTFLKGVANTVKGSVVVFDEAFSTLLASSTNNIGQIAVALGAVVTNKYGWYQTGGKAPAKVLTAFADNSKVFLTATDGSVDDSGTGGQQLVGAFGRSAIDTPLTGFAYLQLVSPVIVGVNVA